MEDGDWLVKVCHMWLTRQKDNKKYITTFAIMNVIIMRLTRTCGYIIITDIIMGHKSRLISR